MEIIFMLLLAFGGVFAVGIIGVIICSSGYFIFRREGNHNGLKTLSAIGAAISLMMLVSSTVMLVPTAAMLTTVPEGYVHTDTVIDEDSYSYDGFCADGVNYVRTDFCFAGSTNKLTPVMSYEPSGTVSKYLYENYYSIENGGDFGFVSSGWDIYCPENELEAAKEFYAMAENQTWNIDGDEISTDLGAIIFAFGESELVESLSYDECEEYLFVQCTSRDEEIIIAQFSLIQNGDDLFYEIGVEVSENIFDFDESVAVVRLPAQLAAVIYDALEK